MQAQEPNPLSRRRLLTGIGGVLAAISTVPASLGTREAFAYSSSSDRSDRSDRWFAAGAFAEELTRTPAQTEGPFYPDKLPLDTDNDLLILNDTLTPAVGTVTHLTGRILDNRGGPIRNATIEIWQVDNNGAYLHTGSDNRAKFDRNFQGYGRFLTGSTGAYYFRTIKPIPYPGRTPHIHVCVRVKGKPKFTTQCYIKGEPQNEKDGVLRGIANPKQRDSVIVDFAPVKGSRVGEVAASFDIVLGFTPDA